MCLKAWAVAVLLVCATGVCAAGNNYVKPTTTLAAQSANNTSAAGSFVAQTNGNAGPGNVSKVDVHSLLYSGNNTKIYAHLMLWFGGSNHMNVGYTSDDATQVHKQITDMISRGIDGVIIDWYGPGNSIDTATQKVMAEAETHSGFTFAIMIDQGAMKNACSGCDAQATLVSDLQYLEKTYFSSPAYMTQDGQPVVTNFDIDLVYTVDWAAASKQISSQPVFLFQNNSGFTHVLSDGSYSWVMPTTTDYGMSYLGNFYATGLPMTGEQTVGATYKGFNDSLASWGKNRVMGQQCGQTWLQTFSKANSLYNSGKQLPMMQLVTWNDYEEGTEIETGISNCVSVSASVSSSTLKWSLKGSSGTVDHYTTYISTDGKNLMPLEQSTTGTSSLNLCSYAIPNGSYVLFVQAVGKPSFTNQISGAVNFTSNCGTQGPTLTFGASPAALSVTAGKSGTLTVTAATQSGNLTDAIALTCSNLPANLTCSFSPASIVPGTGAASSTLTVRAGKTTSTNQFPLAPFSSAIGLSAVGIVVAGGTTRKRLGRALAVCGIAAMIFSAAACGVSSGASTSTTPAGNAATYSITVDGNASSVQVSTTIAVTVK